MTITSRGAVAPVADQVGAISATAGATPASVDVAALDATVNLVSDHAPGWLSHPTLTGMTSREFGQMLTAFSEHLAASPPVSLTPRSYLDPRFGARILSPRDRLLATIISQRWSASRSALASVLGISQSLLARAISETTQDLATMGKTIPPAPIKATTTAALMALIGQEPDPKK